MRSYTIMRAAATVLSLASAAHAVVNYTAYDLLMVERDLMNMDRPDDCPPCFNCMLPAFQCANSGQCSQLNGRCECPPGFGGEACLQPTCGSLAAASNRTIRKDEFCQCDDGWTGVNCNVCTTNQACNALMPESKGGVCYQNGEVVKQNFQQCDVTNKKIRELLNEKVPQVTFTCDKEDGTCDFQFWVQAQESFYCSLDTCQSSSENTYDQNSTNYQCEHISCSCISDRMLCGQDGSVDIGDFLKEEIKGPASFKCLQQDGGINNCAFDEPAMNGLIAGIFGDASITLTCRSGECLYETEVPGFERPVKRINTPLIAGIIAGCSLFVVAVILLVWFLSRRRLSHSPIYLEDSDDESSKLMLDHNPASLQFKEVSYEINGKRILNGIQGVARPGQLMAIMGASGAGKTSFLDILARKNKRGSVKGDFYVNGEKVNDVDYRNVVGFVDQEDTMLPTLTVHETIMNSAMLRLPRDMGNAAKEQRVYEVEKQLGILHIRDSLIGSEEGKGRGISGGEKRRVGIACELVTSPSILFLDEPTSGLDAFNAFNVIECLVTLAKTYSRTVIFTIHQPRSNIVALFDQLVLLAQGKTVYSGEFSKCQAYFESIGYACPPGFNIADYLVDLTMHVAAPQTPFADDVGEDGAGADDEDDNAPLLRGDNSIAPSSTRAIKSVASRSASIEESVVGSPAQSLLRPQSNRRRTNSIKAQQDRELFTRKKSGMSASLAEDREYVKLRSQQPQVNNYQDMPSTPGGSELEVLIAAYLSSDMAADVHTDIQKSVNGADHANGRANGNGPSAGPRGALGRGYARVGFLRQFAILSVRTWRNLYRNPMLMLTHYAIAIVLAVLSGYLFYGLTDDIPGFQNRLGLFFFLLALFGFSTLTSLTVFAAERLLFVRERANGYYHPLSYFLAKVVFDIVPLRIIPPLIMGAIVYPMTGLVPDAPHFFKFLLVLVLFNLAASSICLFIGIVCRDASVANLIGSLVMLFSLLFAGLLLNASAIPAPAKFLQKLSIFHYGLETLVVNEVTYLTLIDHKYGLDITVPGASILSSFGFDTQALWGDITSLGMFASAFIVLAYGAMHVLLVEKR